MDNYYTTTLSGNIYWRNPLTPHTPRSIVERREYLDGTVKYVDSSGRVISTHELNEELLRQLKIDYLETIEKMYRRRREMVS